MATSYDILVIGAGIAGSVLASRLKESHPSLHIALVEAGPDERSNAQVQSARSGPITQETPLAFQYTSEPVPEVGNRVFKTYGGRMLGGGSAINYTAWTRGNAVDYDRWAALVGSERWSYQKLLPFFRASETFYDPSVNPDEHSATGPILTSCEDRGYPLRQPIRDAFESTGATYNPDIGSGNPNGLANGISASSQGQRQNAAARYPLDGVAILPNSPVHKVLFSPDGRATSVQLLDGQTLAARREIILSCGALRTPQLLMLSGIGPAAHLASLSIPLVSALPVGQNHTEHGAVNLLWRLRHPERGLSLGSPAFNDPRYFTGAPLDWFVTGQAPDDDLARALAQDGNTTLELAPQRSDFELPVTYYVSPTGHTKVVDADGSHITIGAGVLCPTSRGTVTLRSTDPRDAPVLAPKIFATEHDRAVLRAGLRTIMRAMESPAGRAIAVGETPPPGCVGITSASPDADLDARIVPMAGAWHHSSGTAAMGSVVDAECRVKGVSGLRVVDASIIPVPLAAHLQAPIYGIAESAAEMIAASL